MLRRHPDIAILFSDVVMPGMSGAELGKIARREFPS
jgi:CheY-like chemotaxis protein